MLFCLIGLRKTSISDLPVSCILQITGAEHSLQSEDVHSRTHWKVQSDFFFTYMFCASLSRVRQRGRRYHSFIGL